jgi:hypothetical protein
LAIDTTAYANGVHTIAWSVTDNQGAVSGIGSRFFTIFNTGGSAARTRPDAVHAGNELGRAASALDALPVRVTDVRVRRGFDPRATLWPISGGLRSVGVWHPMHDRIEVHLDGEPSWSGVYEGYLVKGDRLDVLPVGSSLDRWRGIFAWQPGVGYTGSYEFLFVRTLLDGRRERIPVRVVLEPSARTPLAATRSVPRPYRGLFVTLSDHAW